MLFNSYVFIFAFLPVTLAVFFGAGRNYKAALSDRRYLNSTLTIS